MTGQYGLSYVYLGTPCIVGKNGVEQVIELDLDAAELAGLQKSAETLTELQASLED